MDSLHPRATVATGLYPAYGFVAPFAAVSFTLTLISDIAYWRTSNLMWHNFSAWLLFFGMIFAAIAALVGAVEFLVRRDGRDNSPALTLAIVGVLVLILAFINNLVHAGDGWTAIVPSGLTLSAVTVLVMAIGAWLGRTVTRRHALGGHDHD
jgi:uncharacterized membrane protein